jgi:anti-anti-sigma factor
MALTHVSVGTVFVWTDLLGDVVITPVGELDLESAPAVLAAIREAIATAPRRIVLDLAFLTFLDSAGCHVLAVAYGEARSAGVRVALRNEMAHLVRRVLAITKLLARFDPDTPSPAG